MEFIFNVYCRRPMRYKKPQTFHYSCNLIHNITSNCWSSTIWRLSTKPEQVVQLVIISKAAWNLNNFSMKWKIFGFNKTHQNWLLHFPPIIFHVFFWFSFHFSVQAFSLSGYNYRPERLQKHPVRTFFLIIHQDIEWINIFLNQIDI